MRKQQVLDALDVMEEFLLGGRNNSENPNMPVPVRIMNTMALAYAEDYTPPESLVIVESFKLLQKQGTYFNE